tara:strand:- start:453 stop:860 length:408 start_codon:yes stop_codon:yes gene_type:complete
MKKLLGIVVLSLFLNGCDNFMDSSKITFEKCRIDNDPMTTFDDYSFEIDKEKNTVVRIIINSDEYIKNWNKNKNNKSKMVKISQETYKIKSTSKNYISTIKDDDGYLGMAYVFDLNNKIIQYKTDLGVNGVLTCK